LTTNKGTAADHKNGGSPVHYGPPDENARTIYYV
jgi:hypothetical protein